MENDQPVSLLINEFKQNLADVINNSILHPEIKDIILSNLYTELHQVALYQAEYEKNEYLKNLKKDSTIESTKE